MLILQVLRLLTFAAIWRGADLIRSSAVAADMCCGAESRQILSMPRLDYRGTEHLGWRRPAQKQKPAKGTRGQGQAVASADINEPH